MAYVALLPAKYIITFVLLVIIMIITTSVLLSNGINVLISSSGLSQLGLSRAGMAHLKI